MTVEDVKQMIKKLSANREAMFSINTMEEHINSLTEPPADEDDPKEAHLKRMAPGLGTASQLGQPPIHPPLAQTQHLLPGQQPTATQRENKRLRC